MGYIGFLGIEAKQVMKTTPAKNIVIRYIDIDSDIVLEPSPIQEKPVQAKVNNQDRGIIKDVPSSSSRTKSPKVNRQ